MSEMEEDVVPSEGEDEEGNNLDEVQLCPLTKETIVQGLSLLCRTGDGLGHAFGRLDLKDKSLTDIATISNYVHLRFLDISNNPLTDLQPLVSLTQLLSLKMDGISVTCFKGQPLDQLPNLQQLNVAMNQVTDLEGLSGPALETLNLIGNHIQRVSGLQHSRLSNLVTLELRRNRLETTDGIYLPNLRHLYLAQNVITRLEGLEKLEHLTTLHLRDNQLETLDGLSPNMKSLRYLNVRGNLISSQNALRALGPLANSLRALVLSENPVTETAEYRLCVLSHVPQLERLDKDPVSSYEKAETRERIKELQEEEEEEEEEEV